jgi:hypothetical protein
MNLCATPEWNVCSSYTCGRTLVPNNTDTNPKNYLNYKYNREGNLKWEKGKKHSHFTVLSIMVNRRPG